MDNSFTFYEFFAGAGLARLGLGSDWKCLWANDIDPKKQEVYENNFEDDKFVLEDIEKLSAHDLPAGADMAWASWPCQDLSLAGSGKGMNGSRSGTFWAFWRIIRDLKTSTGKPHMLALENVPGLLTSARGQDFKALCNALADLDMQFGALVINARYFVPQSRPRVFIVAVDRSIDCSDWYSDEPTEPLWVTSTLQKAADSLPEKASSLWRWWSLPKPTEEVEPLKSLVEVDLPAEAWNSDDDTNYLLNLMTEVHLDKVDSAIQEAERRVGTLYKRTRQGQQRAEVRFDGISGCLRTPNGGSSRQTVMVVENGKVRSRLITPRECARLMGVPETFWLPQGYNPAYHAMGDAVVVPVVRWLSEHLMTPIMRCIKQDRKKANIEVEQELAS